MKLSKIVLGTAQFGLDYGINNKTGQISKEEVFDILRASQKNGIDTIQTSYAYGNSEEIISEFIKKERPHLKIISKLPLENVEQFVKASLEKFNCSEIYAYLVNEPKQASENPEFWDKVKNIKKLGKVKKIGYSLNRPEEIEWLLKKKIAFDIVQVPFSVLDQRFAKMFPLLKKENIEIHARSVFLQGLMFKKPEELKGKFIKLKEKISELQSISREKDVPISAICMNFVMLNKYVDKIVIGVDSLKNLKENLKIRVYRDKVDSVYGRLMGLKENDENVILPINWSN